MGKQEDFIAQIQPWVTAWHDIYGWGVISAIIGQACLESGYGTSDKVVPDRNNYFGLKYKPNRVTCNNGTFTSTSAEYKDGKYYPIITEWFKFPDMNTGVRGYFQFISTGPYKVQNITDPRAYLTELKAHSYATGPNYVENVMAVIEKYNLTQYDVGGNNMSHPIDPNRKPDSPLAVKAIWSPNNTYPRQTTKKPSQFTIIPHCIAGNPTAEAQAKAFANPNRGASAHYIIDSNGVIVQGVPEDCRAWTTGGDLNVNGLTGSMMDHESITFEIANITREPWWAMSEQAINSLVLLCVDICKRNGIPALKWQNNKFLAGQPDKQNVAVHRWFARKSCPGDFLMLGMENVVTVVNAMLAGSTPVPQPTSGHVINGVDYDVVFNDEYYRSHYPDVASSDYGNIADGMWKHFCDFGMNELRQACEEFDPKKYKADNADLVAAFGDDNFQYYQHYIVFGKQEIAEGKRSY